MNVWIKFANHSNFVVRKLVQYYNDVPTHPAHHGLVTLQRELGLEHQRELVKKVSDSPPFVALPLQSGNGRKYRF